MVDWRSNGPAGGVAVPGCSGGGAEDFSALLQRQGLYPQSAGAVVRAGGGELQGWVQTQATTILAFKFAGGILMAGDRRATAGNLVVYDRADKVLQIDPHSLMAIAGVPATAWEMARVLEHSFQFYRRSQLQEMSHEGKVRALSKLLRDNLGFVLQGVGVVIPLFATYDPQGGAARLYFYDAMGAQFEAADYAASGSGSGAIRSILHYENTWGKSRLRDLHEPEALVIALRALETAAESDTATGGFDRRRLVYPLVKIISQSGVRTLAESELEAVFAQQVS